MFHLVNDTGNAHRFTESAARRDELLLLGYTEVKAPAEVETPAEVAETPAEVAETPAEVAETPAEVETPEKPKTGGKGKKTDKTDKKED